MSTQNDSREDLVSPVLKSLRFREVKQTAPGHTAKNQSSALPYTSDVSSLCLPSSQGFYGEPTLRCSGHGQTDKADKSHPVVVCTEPTPWRDAKNECSQSWPGKGKEKLAQRQGAWELPPGADLLGTRCEFQKESAGCSPHNRDKVPSCPSHPYPSS